MSALCPAERGLPFPAAIDSSNRRTWSGCETQGVYNFFEHLRLREESVDLIAGHAFAAGLEAMRLAFYRDGRPSAEALEAGQIAAVQDWGERLAPMCSWMEGNPGNKSLDRVVEALAYYVSVWPLATDALQPLLRNGIPGIEFSFALPIPGTRHPQTGDPIMYCGRADMLALFNGALFVDDEKTSKSLGGTFARKWQMRSQLTGYSWACRQMGYDVAGCVIRGVSFLKDSFGSAECVTYREPWKVDRWLAQLQADIADMVAVWRGDRPARLNLDATCDFCPYQMLCDSADPDAWRSHYVVSPWNPLAHTP